MRRFLLVAAVFLAMVLSLSAGIVVRSSPLNEVRIGGRPLRDRWAANAPTISSRGEYLAYDPKGGTLDVVFVEKRGPGTSWEFASLWKFEETVGRRGQNDLEHVGFSFFLRATDGPYAGWYVAREKDELRLVKNMAQAAKVVVVTAEREVTHK